MKKIYLFSFITVLLVLINYSCNNEEVVSNHSTELITEPTVIVPSKFLEYNLSDPKIKPNWETAILINTNISSKEGNEAVEFNFSIDNKIFVPLSKNKKNRGRQRLLLTTYQGGIIETIIEYIPSDRYKGNILTINSGNFKLRKFDGIILFSKPNDLKKTVWHLTDGVLTKKTTRLLKKINKTLTSRVEYVCEVGYEICVGSGEVYCETRETCSWVDVGDDYENPFDPSDCSTNPYLPWCYDDGSDGIGGGGDGGGENGNPSSEEAPPPSCESFNFTSLGGNWQESAVKNIHFNIVLLTPNGYHYTQLIDYPNAILFGAPTSLSIGNTPIDAGIAANLSAKALQQSMNDVIDRYGAAEDVPELTLKIYFEQRLKHNYPLYIPGGRVNFNSSSNLNATNYKTNLFGTGGCN